MEPGHRQQWQNIEIPAFSVEDHDISRSWRKRDVIPVRHFIFVSIRHLQDERKITFDRFLDLVARHNKEDRRALFPCQSAPLQRFSFLLNETPQFVFARCPLSHRYLAA